MFSDGLVSHISMLFALPMTIKNGGLELLRRN